MTKKTKPRVPKKPAKVTKNQYLWFAFAVVICLSALAVYSLQKKDSEPKLPPPPSDAKYKQANIPIDERVNDLLSRMSLEEKIGQMALVDKNSLIKPEDIAKYHLGGVLSGAGAKPQTNTPKGWQDMVSVIKGQASNSRLQIPLLYGIDANHGNGNVLGSTVFPHAIGLGASHNPELVKQIAAATADEVKAIGVNWSFSPDLDAPKDIRWGRVYEAFSDDPSLNSLLGAAAIDGTQKPTGTTTAPYVLATAKHFIGNGAMEWKKSYKPEFQIDQGTTPANEELLKTEYLPPFQAAVNADVASVMVALNHWGDIRTIDSKYLLTDKLKTELGFKGFVVSDWYGGYEFSRTSTYQANITAINAGLDMFMLPYDYKTFISEVKTAVKRGAISQSRIDDANRRILTQKFKAGLFDQPQTTESLDSLGSVEHRQLARKAVAESAVLLKNDRSALPLLKNGQNILVAGSGADNVGRQCGAWTVEWQGVDGNWMPGGTSILQAIRNEVSNKDLVKYSKDGTFTNTQPLADIGIVVISENPYAEGKGDNANPTISKQDQQTIARVKQRSKKLVVVMVSGRPLLINDQIPNWDAAVAAWLPGSEGGGIADVLFSNQPFTGKLPITWPASLLQLPITSKGITKDGTKPLFERSYGL